ncbi:hypothetical protein [Paraburkholderia fynbosensis]|uniref:hypothetical protein n=1 Tax=Paraburkholderia fynbosensis TaxID=1200993 RepID=UPI001581CDC1|nr:hypothetical protein [Paraburkholderia fynbosensis]
MASIVSRIFSVAPACASIAVCACLHATRALLPILRRATSAAFSIASTASSTWFFSSSSVICVIANGTHDGSSNVSHCRTFFKTHPVGRENELPYEIACYLEICSFPS